MILDVMNGVEPDQIISGRNGSFRLEQPDGSTLIFSWRIDALRGLAFAMWSWDRGEGQPSGNRAVLLRVERPNCQP